MSNKKVAVIPVDESFALNPSQLGSDTWGTPRTSRTELRSHVHSVEIQQVNIDLRSQEYPDIEVVDHCPLVPQVLTKGSAVGVVPYIMR